MTPRGANKSRQELGRWVCISIAFPTMLLMLLYPFTQLQIRTWPIAALFALLIVGAFFGCGSIFRGRPQFKSHYHGEHTVVLDEIDDEIGERE